MSGACSVFGNLANAGGLAGLAAQGAIGLAVGYKTIYSPHTTLRGTWETLLNIKAHLEAITDEQRLKIEAAAQMRLCKSLTDINREFQDLWNDHSDLSQEYDQSSHFQRHLSGELRSLINNLEFNVKSLLNDTRTTTRAQPIMPATTPPPPGDQSSSTDTRTRPLIPTYLVLPSIPSLPSLSLGNQRNSMDITTADRLTGPTVPYAIRESIEMNAV